MYGLEDQKKKKKAEEFIFELEKKLSGKEYHTQTKAHAERRLYQFKDLLHKGCDKAHFDKIGCILYGYAALLRVVSRFTPSG